MFYFFKELAKDNFNQDFEMWQVDFMLDRLALNNKKWLDCKDIIDNYLLIIDLLDSNENESTPIINNKDLILKQLIDSNQKLNNHIENSDLKKNSNFKKGINNDNVKKRDTFGTFVHKRESLKDNNDVKKSLFEKLSEF